MTVMHHPSNLYPGETAQMDLATAKIQFSAGVFDEYWAETRRLKIRGSVNKALKVYNAMGIADAEELILCAPDEPKRIYAEIKKTGRIPRGCGFKNLASVKVWASNLSSFFDVVSGRRAAINVFHSIDDDWAALIDHVVGRNQGPVLLNTYQRQPLNILARECRLRGIPNPSRPVRSSVYGLGITGKIPKNAGRVAPNGASDPRTLDVRRSLSDDYARQPRDKLGPS